MMIKNKFFLLLGVLIIAFSSCEDGLTDLNIDPNNPVEVPPSNLVTQAQFAMSNRLWSRGFNAEWSMLMVQQWAQNEYTEESRFSGIDGNDFDTEWIELYAEVLNELEVASNLINAVEDFPADTRANQLAVINILKAYTYHNLTDAFGAIPFSQALNSVDFPKPEYDQQQAVYDGILALLDGAGTSIVEGGDGFGAADIVYSGDMSKWKKLAYSLMMRVAMRMVDVDGGKAADYLGRAQGKAFASNADNALFIFSDNPSIANPLFVDVEINNRDDFAVSELLVNSLVDRGDPRLNVFADTTLTGTIVGMPYGLEDGDAFALKSTTSRPHPNVRIATAPAIIMDYAEVSFILAEAYQRGILSGNAADAYADGVRASMNYWGIMDDAAIDAYLANSANSYMSDNWKMSIGMQKWFAFYMNGPQAWAEWRRLDVPSLSASAAAQNGGVIPVRLPYPISEQTRNSESLSKVSSSFNDLNTKLWWDVN